MPCGSGRKWLDGRAVAIIHCVLITFTELPKLEVDGNRSRNLCHRSSDYSPAAACDVIYLTIVAMETN